LEGTQNQAELADGARLVRTGPANTDDRQMQRVHSTPSFAMGAT
jgi:hypothetical protein